MKQLMGFVMLMAAAGAMVKKYLLGREVEKSLGKALYTKLVAERRRHQ